MHDSKDRFIPDGVLLEQFVAGADQDCFRQIVERDSAMILGTARRVLGDHSEAEDVCQTTFVALARKAHFLSGQQSVAGWLHRVARQMAIALALPATPPHREEAATNLLWGNTEPSGNMVCTRVAPAEFLDRQVVSPRNLCPFSSHGRVKMR